MYSAQKIIPGFLDTAVPDLLQYVCYAIAYNLCLGIKRRDFTLSVTSLIILTTFLT